MTSGTFDWVKHIEEMERKLLKQRYKQVMHDIEEIGDWYRSAVLWADTDTENKPDYGDGFYINLKHLTNKYWGSPLWKKGRLVQENIFRKYDKVMWCINFLGDCSTMENGDWRKSDWDTGRDGSFVEHAFYGVPDEGWWAFKLPYEGYKVYGYGVD